MSLNNRQSVKVTYAHKRRRVQNASKKLLSSPLEALPPETGELTRTQMARRMLKRSRRVALAEQLEDKNVEHIREHLAKRIKCNQERILNIEPIGAPFDMPPQNDLTFRTPFPSSHSVHDATVANPRVPEQLSPVPAAKRVRSRTSSRNLKENSSQTLASPFSSLPGSTTSSPKHNGRGRSSRRVIRSSLHAKSRTLSGVFKENTPQVSRKNSTLSLQNMGREPRVRYIKRQRYLSSPSSSYMRSQLTQEDWIIPPKALSRTFDDYDAVSSPRGTARSDTSFFTGRPQSCSTPAISRLRKAPDPLRRETGTDGFFASFSLPEDSTGAGGLDVEMVNGAVSPQRQTVHLSGNSIFSSSDEFTLGTLPSMSDDATTLDRNDVTNRKETLAGVIRQASVRRIAVARSQAGRTLTGSYVAEYDIPLSDTVYPPASTAAIKTLGPQGRPKLSFGEQLFDLPGTSPAHGGSLTIRTCKKAGTQIPPPTSPNEATAPCPPSSPASDLAQEFGSMDIRAGDLDPHSDDCPSAPIALLTRSYFLQDALALAEPTTRKSVKRIPARDRAGTIRASDFVNPGPGVPSSGGAPSLTVSSLPDVRRTRSGTVVGPHSKLATNGAGTKGILATGRAAVQSRSESESDDELLLKAAWIEDLEYLGLAVPADKGAEADELNLSGLWSGPPRRLGLRRR